MTTRYAVTFRYGSSRIDQCPRYGDYDHYVFMCMSECENYLGKENGEVLCNYDDERKN